MNQKINRRNLMIATGTGAMSAPLLTEGVLGQTTNGLNVTLRQIDRTNFPEVTLFVGVEKNNTVVDELSESDFAIEEQRLNEGLRDEAITEFSQPDGTTTTNISTSIVIDRSGSMRGSRIENAREGAKEFVSNFSSGDEATVIEFGSDVETTQPWTTNTDVLTNAIDSITIDGWTALYDAVIRGINEASDRLGRNAVVLLADGENNRGTNDFEDLKQRATEEGIPVYAIGLGNNVSPQRLQDIATETGGEYYSSADGDDLAEVYQEIRDSITEEYAVTYETSDQMVDGEKREVTVTATDGVDSGSDTDDYLEPCRPLPTAVFDLPDQVLIDQSVEFDATESHPNGGTIDSYEWDFTNDGSTDATGETATYTYTDPGDYTARLTVSKGCPGPAEAKDIAEIPFVVLDDEVIIDIVETNAPITEGETLTVNVRIDNRGTTVQGTVALLDFVGEPVIGSGTAEAISIDRGAGENIELSWETELGDANSGDLTVGFEGRELTESITITESQDESEGNLEAQINQSAQNPAPDEQITFDAAGSTGNIDTYQWSFDDGTTSTGETVDHQYDTPGTYDVTLTIIGQDGAEATAQTEVTVKKGLSITFRPEQPVVNEPVSFTATGGENYQWDFDDENAAVGKRVTHRFGETGSYDVSVSSESGSATQEITVESVPIKISDISREVGGVPIKSVPYEDTFKAEVESENPINQIEFELGDQSTQPTNTGNTWEKTFDLGELDRSDALLVTASDTEGFEVRDTVSVPIKPVPDWMEWLLNTADISVNKSSRRIQIVYDPFDLSFSFDLSEIAIDVDPPVFEGAPDAKLNYDAGEKGMVVDADGGIETDLFGYGFQADMEIEAVIDSNIDLQQASGEAFASLSANVGPPLGLDIPDEVTRYVNCMPDQVGIDTSVEPGVGLDSVFDDELEFEEGTVTPETKLVVESELSVCGVGVGATATGKLEASFDVGTANANLSGTVSIIGDAWANWRWLTVSFSPGFSRTLPVDTNQMVLSQAESNDNVEISTVDKHGSQPEVGMNSVDDLTKPATTNTSLSPVANDSNSYQRLTDRPLEDTEPAITIFDENTLVVWSRQRDTTDVTDGRDIAYRIKTDTGWSEVLDITTDNKSNTAPAVATSGDSVLVAWEFVDMEITGEDPPDDLASEIEIAYAIYDGDDWSEPQQLTNTRVSESQPTVAPTDNGWLVAWDQGSTDPQPDVRQGSVRYTEISLDSTVSSTTRIPDAISPDVGHHTGSGAVLGYTQLNNGKTEEVVSSKIINGSQIDTQRFNANAVNTVTVGEDRVIWQEGEVDNPTIREGNRGTLSNEELDIRQEVVSITEPTLTTDGDKAVLAYRAYVDQAETRELVYRLNRGSGWVFDRQFVQAPDSNKNQTIWQPKAAFKQDTEAFKTVFAIKQLQQQAKNDIFITDHEFLPEYAISADGPSGKAVGDSVTIEYAVKNRGDITGTENITVNIENSESVQATETFPILDAGETKTGTADVIVDETGVFELSIETSETSLTTKEITSDQFVSRSTVVRVATPQLTVEEINTCQKDTIGITINNSGGASAFDIPIIITDGENKLADTTISKIIYDSNEETTVTVYPEDIDRSRPDEIILDPEKTLPEGAVSDTSRITPTWLLQPNLIISSNTEYKLTDTGHIEVSLLVGNKSPVAGTGTVRAITDNGTIIGENTIHIEGTTGGPRYEQTLIKLNSGIEEGNKLLFEIDPEVPDADSSNLNIKEIVPISDEVSTEPSPEDYITDGETSTQLLRQAIDDWRSGKIQTNTLREVINNWRK